MTYLKELAPGDDSGQSQRLLNEVAQARVCLLTKDKKAAYDQQLRSQLAPAEPPPLAAPHPPPGPMADLSSPPRPIADGSAVGPGGALPAPALPRVHRVRAAKRPAARRLRLLGGISVAGLVLVVAGLSVWYAAKGKLVIQSQEPGVEVIIKRDGKEIERLTIPEREIRARLWAGVYSVEVAGPRAKELFVSNGSLRMPPRGEVVVSIQRRLDVAVGSPADDASKDAATTETPTTVEAPKHAVTAVVPPKDVPTPEGSQGGAAPGDAPAGPLNVLLFEGPRQWVELRDTNRLASANAVFTAETWVRWPAERQFRLELFGTFFPPGTLPDNSAAQGWDLSLAIDPAQRTGLILRYAGSAPDGSVHSGYGEAAGAGWHHVVLTKDQQDQMTTFVDGKRVWQAPWAGGPDAEIGNLRLGAVPTSRLLQGGLHGQISAFRLSTVCRYANDFAVPSTGQFDRDQDTCVLLDFSQPQPGTINDASGYGHHGTIVGARWMQALGDELRELIPIQPLPQVPPELVHAEAGAADDRDPAEMPKSPPAEPAATNLAIPDAAARNAARKQVQDLYRQKLSDAKTFLEKRDLAEELLTLAIETKDDSASRYVLFEEAAELATQAPDFDVAMRAVEEWGKHFEVDIWALKKEALKDIGAEATLPHNARRFAEAVLPIVDAAEAAEKWDEASDIHKLATAAAARSGDGELRTKLRGRGERLEAMQKQGKLAEQARQRLEAEPDNPLANAALGKYLCLVRQQWEKGLPYLCKSDDGHAALKQAAEKDRQSPAAADERIAAANLWWEAAQAAKGFERESLLARAGHWYHQALDDSSGITRAGAEDRIEKIKRELPEWKPEATGQVAPPSKSPPTSLADLTNAPAPAAATKSGSPPGAGRVVLNPGTGKVPATTPPPALVLNTRDQAESLAISPDGKFLVAGTSVGVIVVWDLQTRLEVGRLAGHTARVACLAFNADGKILASGDDGGTVKLWSLATGKEVRTHRGPQAGRRIRQVAFSPDGKLLAIGGDSAFVELCEAKSGDVRHQIEGIVTALAFSPDSKMLATARQKIALYDVTSGQEAEAWDRKGRDITALAFSADGRSIAAASDDGTVRVTDAASGAEDLVIIDSAPFLSLGFSPDGARLWFAGGSCIKIVDSATGQAEFVLGSNGQILSAVGATSDGKLLAGASGRVIAVWDLRPRRRR
jgi:WD40 repeat protein